MTKDGRRAKGGQEPLVDRKCDGREWQEGDL